jgi:hypothetical protein
MNIAFGEPTANWQPIGAVPASQLQSKNHKDFLPFEERIVSFILQCFCPEHQ